MFTNPTEAFKELTLNAYHQLTPGSQNKLNKYLKKIDYSALALVEPKREITLPSVIAKIRSQKAAKTLDSVISHVLNVSPLDVEAICKCTTTERYRWMDTGILEIAIIRDNFYFPTMKVKHCTIFSTACVACNIERIRAKHNAKTSIAKAKGTKKAMVTKFNNTELSAIEKGKLCRLKNKRNYGEPIYLCCLIQAVSRLIKTERSNAEEWRKQKYKALKLLCTAENMKQYIEKITLFNSQGEEPQYVIELNFSQAKLQFTFHVPCVIASTWECELDNTPTVHQLKDEQGYQFGKNDADIVHRVFPKRVVTKQLTKLFTKYKKHL